jgi:hypothetical protein
MTTDALLAKIQDAVAAVSRAEGDLVAKSKTLGTLLLEAKQQHPAVKDFETYLKRVDGVSLSRAYDYMRIAGGRTTDEELRKDARERQKKSREKRKLPKREPEPFRDVTESKKRKPEDKSRSAEALAGFSFAARTYLPRMSAADAAEALRLVIDLVKPEAEAP